MVRDTYPVGDDVGRGRVDDQLSDLNTGVTLSSDRFVDVWNRQASRSEYLALGKGVSNNVTNVGRFFAKLSDSAANTIDGGTFRVVVYEDSDRDFIKAIGPEFGVKESRDSADADRTDQLMLPLLNPGAREDQHVALQLKADADNDGNTVDEGNSTSFNIPFTAFRQR